MTKKAKVAAIRQAADTIATLSRELLGNEEEEISEEAKMDAFKRYPYRVLEGVIEPMARAGLTTPTNSSATGAQMTGNELYASLMQMKSTTRFALDPYLTSGREPVYAETGVLLAIPTSDIRLPLANDEQVQDLKSWYRHMQPVIESGHVWVGGEQKDDSVQVRGFLMQWDIVLPPEHEKYAKQIAKLWFPRRSA